jgi:hypothetical protein
MSTTPISALAERMVREGHAPTFSAACSMLARRPRMAKRTKRLVTTTTPAASVSCRLPYNDN